VPYFYDSAAVSVCLSRLLGEERNGTAVAAAAKCISSYPGALFLRSFFFYFTQRISYYFFSPSKVSAQIGE
jgi:hypothetical protein